MNSVPTLTTLGITAINGLVKRPVFFLNLNNSPTPSVVVKGDHQADHAAVSIAWGSKLMKNVQNNLVNTKIMTPEEITAFKNAGLRSFKKGTPQQSHLSAPYIWVKMPYVPGVTDADFINDDASLNLKQVKQLIPKLSDSQIWRDLGAVVAVDIFNGNSDRFVVHMQDTRPAGTWANRGNIMFLGANLGHTTTVIGLDTFDPNATVNNLQSGGGFEGLKALINPVQCNFFASVAAKSVGKQIQFWLRDTGHRGYFTIPVRAVDGAAFLKLEIDKMDTLFEPYANDFAQGITLGSARLKQYLDRKLVDYGVRLAGGAPLRPARALPGQAPARPGHAAGTVAPAARTIPQGVLDRMKYLGWL